MARGLSKTEQYHKQYKFLHQIQRDLTEAGVTCHYRNRALTNGTPNSPFSVFFAFGSMSNGETVMELNVHIDDKIYSTFGETGQTQMGLALIKSRYGSANTAQLSKFANRINPTNLGYSPKMTAIVGAIIGFDYGVRDRKGGLLSGLSITSDGYVMASSTASDGGGAFIGSANDLNRNLADYQFVLAGESDEDAEEFAKLYAQNVKDWRK